MKSSTKQKITDLLERYPALWACRAELIAAAETVISVYRGGGKLLVCGNGGSAADSDHIVGELMKGFILPRKLSPSLKEKLEEFCPEEAEYLCANLQGALPAISLPSQTAINTAFANDQAPDLAFAQQVLGLGKAGDGLIAISTSGNSANVVYAAKVAKALGLKVIGLSGADGGKLKKLCEVCVCAPSAVTYKVQEYHLPIYHALCIAAEHEFFG